MSAPLNLAGLLGALVQQQTALLELHRETLRLERLLVEHLLARAPAAAAPPESGPESESESAPEPAPVLQLVRAEPPPPPELPATPETPPEPQEFQEPQEPQEPPATTRAARYLRGGPSAGPRATRPVTRRDVERITRLYEAGDAAHLIIQFGPYKGATLLQVAELDPDYVRRLAQSAQRPQVRAAARQVVAALDAGPSTSEPRTRARPRRGG